ncbi:MAG: thioredoxin family protein [Bacillota bacterium]|nr:thioredoxin family protein [Bacillota bacterium]
MNLNEWFEKGLTPDEYINGMEKNKEEMVSLYKTFMVGNEEKERLEKLKNKGLKVISITEDWCGDALLNNPILMKLAEAGGIELRFLLRDQNLELMDQYLTNGTSRAIPIFIFIDNEGNEAAVWGPRAPQMQERVDKGRVSLPDKEAADFQEKQMEFYKQLVKSYVTDESIWKMVSESIVGALSSVK